MSHISIEQNKASFDLHGLNSHQREVIMFAADVLATGTLRDDGHVLAFRLPLSGDTPALRDYLESVDHQLDEIQAS